MSVSFIMTFAGLGLGLGVTIRHNLGVRNPDHNPTLN